VTKNWIALSVLAVALTVSGSTCFACGDEKKADDTKDAKAVAANGEAKGCDMPCCAHAAAAANEKNAAAPAGEKPSATLLGLVEPGDNPHRVRLVDHRTDLR